MDHSPSSTRVEACRCRAGRSQSSDLRDNVGTCEGTQTRSQMAQGNVVSIQRKLTRSHVWYTHKTNIMHDYRCVHKQNKEDLYAIHVVTRLQTAHQKFKTHTCSLRAVKEANSTWLFVVIYISRQTSPLESGLLYFATALFRSPEFDLKF